MNVIKPPPEKIGLSVHSLLHEWVTVSDPNKGVVYVREDTIAINNRVKVLEETRDLLCESLGYMARFAVIKEGPESELAKILRDTVKKAKNI